MLATEPCLIARFEFPQEPVGTGHRHRFRPAPRRKNQSLLPGEATSESTAQEIFLTEQTYRSPLKTKGRHGRNRETNLPFALFSTGERRAGSLDPVPSVTVEW